MKPNILFVDDEVNVLSGIRRLLRSKRSDWEMFFAESGFDALKVMEKHKMDVVVSDMRMPNMDGADFFIEVEKKQPGAVRIILSGYADKESLFRAAKVSHRYLSKPCDHNTMVDVVTRAIDLRRHLSSEKLRSLVSSVHNLPTPKEVYVELLAEIRSHKASARRIAEIVGSDAGLSAKVLQMANSAYFCMPSKISSPLKAVNILGVDTIASLALNAGILVMMNNARLKGVSAIDMWFHSLLAGQVAAAIGNDMNMNKAQCDDLFTAGLLHDVGKLFLAGMLGDKYSYCLELMEIDEISLEEAEIKVFEATHADIGAYLMALWGLPEAIIEIIAYHHQPYSVGDEGFDTIKIMAVTEYILGEDDAIEKYFKTWGIEEKVEGWKKLADNIKEQLESRYAKSSDR